MADSETETKKPEGVSVAVVLGLAFVATGVGMLLVEKKKSGGDSPGSGESRAVTPLVNDTVDAMLKFALHEEKDLTGDPEKKERNNLLVG